MKHIWTPLLLATFLVFLAFLYAPAFPGQPSLSTLEQQYLQRKIAEEQASKPDQVKSLGPAPSAAQPSGGQGAVPAGPNPWDSSKDREAA